MSKIDWNQPSRYGIAIYSAECELLEQRFLTMREAYEQGYVDKDGNPLKESESHRNMVDSSTTTTYIYDGIRRGRGILEFGAPTTYSWDGPEYRGES